MEEKTPTDDFRGGFRMRVTYGELLPNGAAIELVAASSGDQLQLLYWDGQKFQIALQIQCGEALYQAPYLAPGLSQAVRFPSSAAEYSSDEDLLTKIASLLQQWMGFDETAAAGVTLWLRSSWLPELYLSPPLLYITGSEKLAVLLFRLLRALCRHPLMVAEFSRRLPFFLTPTFLIYDPGLSPKRQASWRACNHRGFFVPLNGNTLGNLASAKAVFSENKDSADAWGPEALRLNLRPTMEPVPELTEFEEQQLAARFQPQLLMHRLRNLPLIQQSGSATCKPPANSELARNLLIGVQDAPAIVKAATPLLVAHEDELSMRRSLDPKAVIVECLWGPAHQTRQIPSAKLLKRVNGLLLSRGESNLCKERELGWKLKQLGIPRGRNGQGMVVRFSRELRRHIHVLARRFGLNLPWKKNCHDCKESQAAVSQEAV